MKKKFYFAFKWPIYILAVLINALLVTVLVLNSLKLGNVGTWASTNFGLDLSALLMSILLIILVNSIFFFSGFTLGDKFFTYTLGIMRYNIDYKDIVTVREEKTSHAMVVNYKRYAKSKNGEAVAAPAGIVINISNKKKEEFVTLLREKNNKIRYELIDKNLEQ